MIFFFGKRQSFSETIVPLMSCTKVEAANEMSKILPFAGNHLRSV